MFDRGTRRLSVAILLLLLLSAPQILEPAFLNPARGLVVGPGSDYQAKYLQSSNDQTEYSMSAVYPLVLGSKEIPIGFIRVWNDYTYLYVVMEIDLSTYPNYGMRATHLNLSSTPLAWGPIGLWPYFHIYATPVTSDAYVIPLASIDGGVGIGDTVYIMAYASIYSGTREVGGAYGVSFKGSFSYTLQQPGVQQASLTVAIAGPSNAHPGFAYLYTVAVSNVGNGTAEDVSLKLKLPSGVRPLNQASPGSPPGTYNENTNTITWFFESIGVGAELIVTVEVFFDESLGEGIVEFEAEVTWDSNVANAIWSTNVVIGPNLLTDFTGPAISYPGSYATYTVWLTNVGDATAYNVIVKVTADWGETEYVSSTPPGQIENGDLVLRITSVPSHTNMLVTFTLKVKEGVQNGTEIEVTVITNWEDDMGNEYSSHPDQWVTIVLSNPLLNVVKTGPAVGMPGQLTEYLISVANLGGSPAVDVNIEDLLPNGTLKTWSIQRVESGEQRTFSINIALPEPQGLCQSFINNVTVSWKDVEGREYTPIWDSVTTVVCRAPMLNIGVAGPIEGVKGEEVTFKITVTNVGGSKAIKVNITNVLPTNLAYTSINPGNADIIDDRTRTWRFGELAPGESIDITLSAVISNAYPSGIWVSDVAYVSWADEYGNLYGPVSDAHLIQLFSAPTPELAKLGPSEAYSGSTITYLLVVENPSSTSMNVDVVDLLPYGLNYISSYPQGDYIPTNNTVKWTSLQLPPNTMVVLAVTSYISPDLTPGTVLLNEALLKWESGTASDYVQTTIVPPSVLTTTTTVTKTTTTTAIQPTTETSTTTTTVYTTTTLPTTVTTREVVTEVQTRTTVVLIPTTTSVTHTAILPTTTTVAKTLTTESTVTEVKTLTTTRIVPETTTVPVPTTITRPPQTFTATVTEIRETLITTYIGTLTILISLILFFLGLILGYLLGRRKREEEPGAKTPSTPP